MYFGFKDISISYGKNVILKNVNMEFPKSKISSIIGPNGCGKSSVLKTIINTVKPTSGQVIYNDKDLREYKIKELAKKIGFLPQIYKSPSDIDIRTLVSYGRHPYKRIGQSLNSKDIELIDLALERTGLTNIQGRTLEHLSGGEVQRTWIAMTLAKEPEILILDEPITYLDIGYQIEVMELVKDLADNLKITVVMVLHDINLASRYSDRIYSISKNGVINEGTSTELLTKDKIKELYDIDSRIIIDEKYKKPIVLPEKKRRREER